MLKLSSMAFYSATGQTFCRTLSKKAKLSASYAMLPKPSSYNLVLGFQDVSDQDCISR